MEGVLGIYSYLVMGYAHSKGIATRLTKDKILNPMVTRNVLHVVGGDGMRTTLFEVTEMILGCKNCLFFNRMI